MIDRVADSAFSFSEQAVSNGRIAGATLGIVDRQGQTAIRLAGKACLVPKEEPLTADHWFDLASLTKVIATTRMILEIAEHDRLDLDQPITDAIPDIRQYDVGGAAERRLTFRDCLSHRTHLPAVEPVYTYGSDPQTLRAFILQREWRQCPPVYSDINYMLLGIAIERITGQNLSDWPLGAGLSYGPPPGPCSCA